MEKTTPIDFPKKEEPDDEMIKFLEENFKKIEIDRVIYYLVAM